MDDLPPKKWNGPHAGKRMAEAFKTLLVLPTVHGPREFGAAWPGYVHDWSDLLAQTGMSADERERDRRAQNRVRLVPSMVEVSRMEIALDWPRRYLAGLPTLVLGVNAMSMAHALDRDAGWIAKRRGLDGETWQQRHWNGCEIISRGLLYDRVAVF